MPRFAVRVVGPSGDGITEKNVIDDCVRMKDGERFRLLFDCDWQSGGSFRFCYDGGKITHGTIAYEEIYAPPDIFVYERSDVGKGRLLEVGFTRNGTVEEVVYQFMIMNNDFTKDGLVIRFGDCVPEEEVVRGSGRTFAENPDRHCWADRS